MRRFKELIILIIITLFSLVTIYAQDTIITLPQLQEVFGTKVKIIPPKNFLPDHKINGFMHPGSSASIQVKEINRPLETVVKSIDDNTFQSQGFTLLKQETLFTNDNKKAVLYYISFINNNVKYERLMLLTGNKKQTVWINANYPEIVKSLIEETLKKSLLSVVFEE